MKNFTYTLFLIGLYSSLFSQHFPCDNIITIDTLGTYTITHQNDNVYLQYTAQFTGQLAISTCGLAQENTDIQVFENCGDNAIGLSSNDNGCGLESMLFLNVTAGQTYYIKFLDDQLSTPTTSYTFAMYYPQLEKGATCESSFELVLGETDTLISTHELSYFETTIEHAGPYLIEVESISDIDVYDASECIKSNRIDYLYNVEGTDVPYTISLDLEQGDYIKLEFYTYKEDNLTFSFEKQGEENEEEEEITSLQSLQKQSTYYPNPTNGKVYFDTEQSGLTIYNLLGEQIISAQNVNAIDLSDLKNGVYLIQTPAGVHQIIKD